MLEGAELRCALGEMCVWSPASLAVPARGPFFLSAVPDLSFLLPPRCPFQTQEGGWGLDGVLKDHAWKLRGIVNGMDYQEWSPVGDVHLQVGRGRRARVEGLAAGAVGTGLHSREWRSWQGFSQAGKQEPCRLSGSRAQQLRCIPIPLPFVLSDYPFTPALITPPDTCALLAA